MKTIFKNRLIRKGYLATLLVLISITLPACFLFEKNDPKPHATIPAELAKKWFAGRFSFGEFWKYDGTYSGNAFETGIAFDFKPGGKCEFYLVAGGTSYSCRTEAFVYKKGTVQFHENGTFTFKPSEGRSRGFYKGCASAYKNYDYKIEKKDLKPETYQYTFGQDSNGHSQLIIQSEQQNISATIFKQTTW